MAIIAEYYFNQSLKKSRVRGNFSCLCRSNWICLSTLDPGFWANENYLRIEFGENGMNLFENVFS